MRYFWKKNQIGFWKKRNHIPVHKIAHAIISVGRWTPLIILPIPIMIAKTKNTIQKRKNKKLGKGTKNVEYLSSYETVCFIFFVFKDPYITPIAIAKLSTAWSEGNDVFGRKACKSVWWCVFCVDNV